MNPHTRVGDYEVLEELGSGGMGRVFRVRNVISDRVDAMKILLPDLVGRQDLASRFVREIKLLATLNHPNIAALRTALTFDNQLVMIMELVEGQSLADRLRLGPIATADALAYLDQVLDALSYAHAQQVIHRDIKPANMMLTPQGLVKLMDFGIARSRNDQTLTATGTTSGSLSYMSPEQVHGHATDARSDLYSLGISLYEMLTGQRPFQADSDFAVMMAHVTEEPRAPTALQPSVGAELNGIVLKAIAKEPAARFQSADEFRQALRRIDQSLSSLSKAARSATMADTAAVSAAVTGSLAAAAARSDGTSASVAPERVRTLVDTRTPSAPIAHPAMASPHVQQVPAPVPRQGHPALYVALGAVLVIAALVGTSLYIRQAQADPGRASGTSEPPPAESATPPAAGAATPPAAVDAAPAPPAATADSAAAASATTAPPTTAEALPATASSAAPATSGSLAPVPAPSTPAASAGAATTASTAPAARPADAAPAPATTARDPAPARAPAAGGAGAATSAPPAPDNSAPAPEATTPPAERQPAVSPAELEELESEIDALTTKAGALNRSLDRLQDEQARQGLGLRRDMVVRQESMNLNLARAQDAVRQRDLTRGRRYRDLVADDVAALEKFLGR